MKIDFEIDDIVVKHYGEDDFKKLIEAFVDRLEGQGFGFYSKPQSPARAPHYLAYVRQQTCAFCGADPPNSAHHEGPRGMGQKTDDYRTIPLCVKCHHEYHLGSSNISRSEINKFLVNVLVRYLRIVEGR